MKRRLLLWTKIILA